MRLARFGLGSGVGPSGVLPYVVPGKARVLFVLRQTRQTATAIAIPGKTIMRTFGKETPLPQQTRERHVGGDRKSNNRLRKHGVLPPTRLPPCRLQQRAGW